MHTKREISILNRYIYHASRRIWHRSDFILLLSFVLSFPLSLFVAFTAQPLFLATTADVYPLPVYRAISAYRQTSQVIISHYHYVPIDYTYSRLKKCFIHVLIMQALGKWRIFSKMHNYTFYYITDKTKKSDNYLKVIITVEDKKLNKKYNFKRKKFILL